MNREVKFRGKRVDTDQWIYGSYHPHQEVKLGIATKDQVKENTKALILLEGMADWNLSVPIEAIYVIPESVGQFTGLKDKNGKEIYEGDIARYSGFYKGDSYEKPGIGFIIWDEEGHSVSKKYPNGEEGYLCDTWDLAKNYGGEVIGNIYEDPGLL